MTASPESWARAERQQTGWTKYTVPHSARVWNYWLGGKDHYPADKLVGEERNACFPDMAGTVRRLRAFTWQAVRFLAREAGIRQFPDIGTGIPAAGNTRQVARDVAPECRVVYADNDPLAMAFVRALLSSRPPGRRDCINGDPNDPGRLLAAARQAGLDLTRPVAVSLTCVLGHTGDPALEGDQAALSVVADLKPALPARSWRGIGDLAATSPGLRAAMGDYNASGADPYHVRSPHHLARFLVALDLVGPALAAVRPPRSGLGPCPAWGAPGRKPGSPASAGPRKAQVTATAERRLPAGAGGRAGTGG